MPFTWGINTAARLRRPRGSIASTLTLLLTVTIALASIAPVRAQDPSTSTGGGTPGGAAPRFKKPSSDLLPSTDIDRTQPLYLQGDQLVYDNSGNSVTARGNVEIYYNNFVLTADEVVYDQSANTLTAVGNVILREPNGNVIRADRYTLTDDFRDGFVQSLSVVAKDDTRIAAARATRRDGNTTEFSDAKFTPCKTEGGMPPLWCISSRRIVHDKQQATITYNDAQFEVFGQPVVYLPYFQHADPSVKRRSGFLPPSFGSSTDLGFSTTVPYYFALAPNYDFTFAPRYMTKGGVLYQGEWRHRLANGEYKITMAGVDQRDNALPEDLALERKEDLVGWRGSLKTQGLFSLSSWWSFGWDATIESDDTFRRFYGLESRIITDRVNKTFFEGMSTRNYFGATLYHFGGLLLDDTPRSESLVHPVIDYNYIFRDPVLGGELRWDSNAYSLSRDEAIIRGVGQAPVQFDQNTSRVTTELTWRRKLIDRIGITYTPFANIRGDVVQFDNYRDPDALDTLAELSNPSLEDDTVTNGVASAGVTVSYPWISASSVGAHTIEPIGQVIARTQTNDRNRLPNEDAQSLVFDDTNLFEIDKFSGYDRTETGTRANVGVQYTFQASNGGYARLLAGQSFQLSGDNPFANPGSVTTIKPGTTPIVTERNIDRFQQYSFNPISGLDTTRSDYVLGAYVAPIEAFRLISQSRFDEETMELRREDLFVKADLGPAFASATYTFTSADPEFGIETNQQDISGAVGLRLSDHWTVQGRMRYDIDEKFILSDAIQLRYADECFVLTATYSERFYTNEDIDTDRTIYLAFEFKHLGLVDYKTDIFAADSGEEQE
ncbi:MAG: LPS assembly protein LptD [Alphaproteobacteria bacterium]|nr:LPS assembly protein LptD [Alphaproteobacteria bacterium]